MQRIKQGLTSPITIVFFACFIIQLFLGLPKIEWTTIWFFVNMLMTSILIAVIIYTD